MTESRGFLSVHKKGGCFVEKGDSYNATAATTQAAAITTEGDGTRPTAAIKSAQTLRLVIRVMTSSVSLTRSYSVVYSPVEWQFHIAEGNDDPLDTILGQVVAVAHPEGAHQLAGQPDRFAGFAVTGDDLCVLGVSSAL